MFVHLVDLKICFFQSNSGCTLYTVHCTVHRYIINSELYTMQCSNYNSCPGRFCEGIVLQKERQQTFVNLTNIICLHYVGMDSIEV